MADNGANVFVFVFIVLELNLISVRVERDPWIIIYVCICDWIETDLVFIIWINCYI